MFRQARRPYSTARPYRHIVIIKATYKDQIVLVNGTRRNGHPACQFPGGRIQKDELVHTAAHRKTREELGLEVQPGRLKLLSRTNRSLELVDHMVHIYGLELTREEWDGLQEMSGQYHIERYSLREAMTVLSASDLMLLA